MLIEDLIEKVASGKVASRIGKAWNAKKPAFQEYVTKKISQIKTNAQNAASKIGGYFSKLGAK